MKILLRDCYVSGTLVNILIEGERIRYIGFDLPPADRILDINGNLVIPGMIDLHTHIRDMRQAHKEDWTSGSAAARAGGVTTIFDMPNTNPATVDRESLQIKRTAAEASRVNFGFYIAATPANYTSIQDVLENDSAAGIKIFLAGSSSNEVVAERDLLTKLFLLAKQFDKPVLLHCESQSCIEKQMAAYADLGALTAVHHSVLRSRKCAITATGLALSLAAETGARVILLHISTMEEIAMIRDFKRAGRGEVYCEVTPHHLLLDEEILQSAGNHGKVNPPIRTKRDNEAILEGILDGTVDTIGSDHAPHGLAEKQKSYIEAPSGFPGLETTLPLLFYEAFEKKTFSIELISKLVSENPAMVMHLNDRGKIAANYYADLTVVDVNHADVVTSVHFHSKAKYSPFEGFPTKGKILHTIINGAIEQTKGQEVHYA